MTTSKWTGAFIILFFLAFISIIGASIAGAFLGSAPASGNIARISISGMILADDGRGVFSDEITASSDVIEFIRRAEENKEIKAILIIINSPGGSAVASAEIAQAIAQANKTTVAVIREVGASGGYWAATSADRIYAHPLSITGSIGVIGSYLDFSGFIDHHNVTYQRYVAGQYKDLGSPFKEPTSAERIMYQSLLDEMHDYFIEDVAKKRNMTREELVPLAQGQVFLGRQAQELGLIDVLGSEQDAIRYLENELAIKAKVVDYAPSRGLADLFRMKTDIGFSIGQGIGAELSKQSMPRI